MNLGEFKAWFEGFTEALDGPPGPKAWKRICEQVKSIKAEPTPSYPTWPYWGLPLGSVGIGGGNINTAYQANANILDDGHSITMAIGSTSPSDAFRLMGRLDAQDNR